MIISDLYYLTKNGVVKKREVEETNTKFSERRDKADVQGSSLPVRQTQLRPHSLQKM